MIRRLTPADAPAFRIVRLEGLRLHPTAFGADHAEEAAQPAAFFAERLTRGIVLGDFVEAELAGLAGLRLPEGRKHAHDSHLWGVYVRPAFRGRGVSAALVEGVIGEARLAGRTWLKLSVEAGNLAARRLYESHGFTVYGREPAAIAHEGALIDDDLMALRLT